jgi:hypothetical protein
LIVSALTPCARIHGDSLASIEQSGYLIELRVTRLDDWSRHVDRIVRAFLDFERAHVVGNDEYRNAALSQGGLSRDRHHSPGLCRVDQLLAVHAAHAIDRLKSTSCGKVVLSSLVFTWLAMRTRGERLRCDSKMPLMKCRLPGPQLPAQAVSRPVI